MVNILFIYKSLLYFHIYRNEFIASRIAHVVNQQTTSGDGFHDHVDDVINEKEIKYPQHIDPKQR